jgi:hypothetical protein
MHSPIGSALQQAGGTIFFGTGAETAAETAAKTVLSGEKNNLERQLSTKSPWLRRFCRCVDLSIPDGERTTRQSVRSSYQEQNAVQHSKGQK